MARLSKYEDEAKRDGVSKKKKTDKRKANALRKVKSNEGWAKLRDGKAKPKKFRTKKQKAEDAKQSANTVSNIKTPKLKSRVKSRTTKEA